MPVLDFEFSSLLNSSPRWRGVFGIWCVHTRRRLVLPPPDGAPALYSSTSTGGSGKAVGFAQALPMADGPNHRQAPRRVPNRDTSRLGAQTPLAAATITELGSHAPSRVFTSKIGNRNPVTGALRRASVGPQTRFIAFGDPVPARRRCRARTHDLRGERFARPLPKLFVKTHKAWFVGASSDAIFMPRPISLRRNDEIIRLFRVK